MSDTFPQAVRLIREIMLQDPDIVEIAPGGIFGGKATQEQMSASVIVISMAGLWKPEIFQQLYHPRIAIHCFSSSDDNSERMSGVVTHKMNFINRKLVTMLDNGYTYLVHCIYVSGGPISYQENTITSANTLYLFATIGTTPTNP